jgi:uncharacterized membrane protein YccC
VAPAPPQRRRISAPEVPEAVISSVILAVSCLVTYWLVTNILTHIYSVSSADDSLGGMWAVIAAIFVFRDSHEQSAAAALSRMAATSVSFVLCLAYLLILPPDVWGMAALIGLGALFVTLIGRSGDAVTTGITTTVVMVVASLSPHDAWQQPILRFFDTVIGIAVGLAAAWISLRAGRRAARATHGTSTS